MIKTYTIEWFYVHAMVDKPQCYRLRICLRQGKRMFQYLVRLRDELSIDALGSCVLMERNEELSRIITRIFKEQRLRCPAFRVSHSSTYPRHGLKLQTCVMRRYYDDYFPIETKLVYKFKFGSNQKVYRWQMLI